MDAADSAQLDSSVYLAAALAAVRGPGAREAQLVAAGRVVCLACGDPIPPARLAAVPGACRCVGCQAEMDSGG